MMMRSIELAGRVSRAAGRWAACAVFLALVGCGGGGGGSGGGGGGSSYTLGGTVSGLGNNSGLVLANGSATLSVPAGATTFTFATSLAAGTAYSVSVQASPAGLKCTVAGGSGTINANVTSVAVTCTAQSYTLGGTVTVNAPAGVTLTDQGMIITNTSNGDTHKFTLIVSSFTMSQSVPYGSAYALTVTTQPTFLNCTLANASGTMPASNVTNVQVTCAGGTESVLHSFGGLSDGASPEGNLVQASDGNFYGVTAGGGAHGNGTVFKITPSGTETVIYSFGASPDGANPYGTLVQASDGTLYGTTQAGGAGYGTVFKITTAGVESVIYSFGAPPDGANPYGGLLLASDGNLYGMTSAGGAGYGTVFQVTTAGVEQVLHSFAASNDGNFPESGLIQGADGNLYGTTHLGGAGSNFGTVFKISTSGATYKVLHSFGTAGDGSQPYGSLVQASDGNLYGTTTVGGANNLGTVFKITTTGTGEAVLHSFGASGDGANPYGRLIQGSDGALYGLTQAGGANSEGTVFQITTAGAEAVLYSFGAATNDGTGPKAGLLQASNGALYGLTPTGGTGNLGTVFEIN
jgi:uncharacterized repeat protein (TIGR03803 family)